MCLVWRNDCVYRHSQQTAKEAAALAEAAVYNVAVRVSKRVSILFVGVQDLNLLDGYEKRPEALPSGGVDR